jgi:TonB family protein
MKPSLRSSFALSILSIVLGLIFCRPSAGARTNLDDLADQLGKGIATASLRSVTVADFSAKDGRSLDLGWYLANRLSDSWLLHDQKFRVLERAELKDAKVSADDIRSVEMLQRLGSVWGVESIVTGVVDVLPDGYVVAASVRRVSNGAVILTASQSIPHSRILDLLNPQGLDMGGAAAFPAGVKGISVPICLKCPIAQYSDQARKAKLEATVTLSVVVSTEGRTARIAILNNPGFGLTDQAIDGVSEWEFRPAKNQEGKAVPVMVPIEMTFRISPN